MCNSSSSDRKQTITQLNQLLRKEKEIKLNIDVLYQTPLGRRSGHSESIERTLGNNEFGFSQ